MIESEWEDLRQKNSPHDIFIRHDNHFQLNIYETSFPFNEGKLRIVCGNDKPCHSKNCSDLRFSISFLQVGIAVGVNGPVMFLSKGDKLHQMLRGNNLMTKYGFIEGSCVISKKAACMDE